MKTKIESKKDEERYLMMLFTADDPHKKHFGKNGKHHGRKAGAFGGKIKTNHAH